MVIVPVPCLGVDGFTDGTEDTQRREIMILDVVFSETTEETNGSGCRVELSKLVLLDGLPVTRR